MPRYIDVEELKKWLERWKGYLDDDMIQRMQICVKDIPTIEDRKKGKWINDGKGLYMCSACGNLWTHWWASVVPLDRMSKELKFCPMCGTDMREEKNDENLHRNSR